MAGPTASGKTGLAIELAGKLDGEIIGADSRQIYRGLDIGTGKPTEEERARVLHHLVDIVDIDESYSAGRFQRDAEEAIAEIQARGKTPLVCGGTGFYLESLIKPMFDEPEIEPGARDQVRAELTAVADRLGRDELHRRLGKVDPASAERLHPNDFQRVSRALEVYYLTGRTLSEFHAGQEDAATYAPYMVLLDPGRDKLQMLIGERVRRMLDSGWIEEVEGLLAAGADEDAPGFQSLGYDEVVALLHGRVSREQALENIVSKTRRFARRQRTWFKRMEVSLRGDAAELACDTVLRGWHEHKVKFGRG